MDFFERLVMEYDRLLMIAQITTGTLKEYLEMLDSLLPSTMYKNDPISPKEYGIKLERKTKECRPKTYLYIPCAKKNLPYQRRQY